MEQHTIIDLRNGFGDFENYKLFKFADNSIKLIIKNRQPVSHVVTTLRNTDDIWTLALITDVLNREINDGSGFTLHIHYLMYQQDDRKFSEHESFGLRVLANFINSLGYESVILYHPHSDVAPALIHNSIVWDNSEFVENFLTEKEGNNLCWIVPDAGAFKSQMKLIEKFHHNDFITCMKSRNHDTGELVTIVNTNDLKGKDCFIVDDICLVGRTFMNISEQLKNKNCGKLYLVVSHGIFNAGVDHLYRYFDEIYTTNSICTLPESDKLKIYKLL